MTFKEYQSETYKNIQPHSDHKDEVINWSIGLCEECGEVMNHVKHMFWGNEIPSNEEMGKELGDVLWYLSALSSSLNLNLDTISQLNKAKLDFRFGNSFSEQKSKDRHINEGKFQDTEQYKELIDQLLVKKSDE